MQSTTTIRNEAETMTAAYAIFWQTTTKLRHVKGLLFPFIFQAILPGWMNKGYPNVLSLDGCTEPLIIINCSVTWAKAKDDELVQSTIRQTLEQINTAAAARQSDHPYWFINYCMEWQRPYEGCGEENLKLMLEASRKYDPDGLFQSGRAGGFKLDIVSVRGVDQGYFDSTWSVRTFFQSLLITSEIFDSISSRSQGALHSF
jgi:hypothetical protein